MATRKGSGRSDGQGSPDNCPITPEQLKAFRDEAFRQHGARGGRPPEKFNYGDEKKALETEARRLGHTTLIPLAFMVWKGILDGSIPCDPGVRARTADSVASRFGFPRRTELSLEIDLAAKYYEMGGYRDSAGVWHEVPVDGREVPAADVVSEPPELSPAEPGANGTNGHDPER